MSYETSSTISAFQSTLPNFEFADAQSFSEAFAQKRYIKKMELPDSNHLSDLKSLCWDNWIANDALLPGTGRPLLKEWYLARQLLHKSLGHFRPGKVLLPKGSEAEPTYGQNSVEARLTQSRWTCTFDNFEAFCTLSYNHKALKRATRRRYYAWYNQRKFDMTIRQSDRLLWSQFKDHKNPAYEIFRWKFERIVKLVHGSRFSTVPKNNEKRRPINIEPFGNILTQRQMGEWLRSEIKRIFGVDLNTLADLHRLRIKDVESIATIDLKDASDSISVDLCRFILPARIFQKLQEFRSDMVYGPDGEFHRTRKISSMGNGFTFELMSLILLAVCRQLDPTSTVFGDDIIIDKEKADRLISCLTEVGLKINFEKSYIDGPFRESCGANYHSDEGYIESYDFLYPESIGDCVLIWNKVVRLSRIYPSFENLRKVLYRSIPKALRGGPDSRFMECHSHDLLKNGWNEESPVTFPLRFVTHQLGNAVTVRGKCRIGLINLSYDPDKFSLVVGWEFKSRLRSPTARDLINRRHWAKYEMYLHSGRRSKDVISSAGEWVKVWFVTSGQETFRAPSLMT